MSRIALRLLLIVCLVLTSTGNAVATVAMPAMSGGTLIGEVAKTVNTPAIACHDAGEPVSGAPKVHHPVEPEAPHPADCDQACCANGACHCPSVSFVQATLVDQTALAAQLVRSRMSAAFTPGHLTPALRDSIRPPI